MEKAFDYLSIEHINSNSNEYRIAGRALLVIDLNTRLISMDGISEIRITNIIYYGKEISEVEPMFTCYLIFNSSQPIKDNAGVLYKI